MPLPAHGVTVVFVELPNTKIELLEPLGADSPVRGFLERNPAGGMHHVCYEVDDIIAARDRLRAAARACSATASRKHRRARQAGAVPASQGFLRHADRARAGVSRGRELGYRDRRLCLIWWVVLFAVLPLGVTRRPSRTIPGTPPARRANPRLMLKVRDDDG